MLSQLRAQTKFWMWIVGGAFILTIVFAWGMDYSGAGSNPILGKVNGRKIMIQEYQAALQSNYQIQRDQLGGLELDDAYIEFIQDQTWQQLVNQILISLEIDRLGLSATNEEILFVLQNDPPVDLRQIQEFQTDGIFDIQKYQAAMQNEAFRGFWLSIETYMRGFIPQQKLEHLISSSAIVTDAEALESYRYRNENVSVQFVSLSPDTHPDSTITATENEIRAYYNSHRSDFEEPAKVDLNYILLLKNPGDRDMAEIQNTLQSLRAQLESGSNFQTLSRQYSDDPGAQDGDLGWVSRGTMVQSFDETAFALEIGEISEPVKTQFGWHIIRVDSIRSADTEDEQRKTNHILIIEEASPTTLDSMYNLLSDLLLIADEKDFTTAARQLELEVLQTGPIVEGGFIPGIGFETKATQFAFGGRIGEVSNVMEHSSAYYLLQVRDRIEAGVAPLEDVRDQISQDLIYDKNLAALKATSRELADRMQQNPGLFTSIAEAESLNVTETGSFTRNDFVTGVGRDPVFISAAFATPVGMIGELVGGENGWYILKVTEHIEVAEEGLQTLIAAEKETLLNTRRQSAFSEWLQGLHEGAKIVDNRSKLLY